MLQFDVRPMAVLFVILECISSPIKLPPSKGPWSVADALWNNLLEEWL